MFERKGVQDLARGRKSQKTVIKDDGQRSDDEDKRPE
jgi:hypothetical protein